MAKLQVSLIWPGCAQGRYTVKARGFLLAVLSWGDAEGPFADWGPFAYVPVDPAGNGSVSFAGLRGIPPRATHVWARCVSHDFAKVEELSAQIPPRFLTPEPVGTDAKHFSLLTDLHLSSKPWRIRQALRAAQSDIVLLMGDSTNDGLPEQFEQFQSIASEVVPDRLLLPVIGNHDVTHPKKAEGDGCQSYAAFQDKYLRRAAERGLKIIRDPDSLAWATAVGKLDIIGLQCVISGRKFLFPMERQLDWLEERLSERKDSPWHLILCHAPLLKHNPNRNDGQPYLDKNRRLQEIVDGTGNILFLSGHTHVSPNVIRGSADWDAERSNLYLDCGSGVDTATEGDRGLMAADWKDGCIIELTISEDVIEIDTRSITTGTHFPRGYYRLCRKNGETGVNCPASLKKQR